MSANNINDFINAVKMELEEVKRKFKESFEDPKDETITQNSNPNADGREREPAYHINTGLWDKHGNPIKIGDTVKLVLENGSIRYFKVRYKTVRRKIFTYPIFEEETADVSITGVVFSWNGFDLFPNANENGESDTDKMEVVS